MAYGLLGLVLGYLAAALVGAAAIALLSTNTHDLGVEAAMTAVFIWGPLGGALGLVTGVVLGGRRGAEP